MMSIQDMYVRGRSNSLNFIRLILAAAVVVWHSYAVLGIPYPAAEYRNLLGALPVNGFFAISGFLIFRSWASRPRVWDYLVARIVRIYPAFWVCLIVTAVVFAPLATYIQGGSGLVQLFSVDTVQYVLRNSTLAMLQWRIGDSPAGIPYTTSWNASLWTLAWEFLCYLALLAFGLLGMNRRRWILIAAFTASLILNLVITISSASFEIGERVGRFSIFFLAGALVAQYARHIKATWWLVLSALIVMVALAWAPQVGIVLQAPATAVGLVTFGGLWNPNWAELRNDISYGLYIYAFPTQQLLVVVGLTSAGLWLFALASLLATVPLAIASWVLVERTSLRLRRSLGYRPWFRKSTVGDGATESSTSHSERGEGRLK